MPRKIPKKGINMLIFFSAVRDEGISIVCRHESIERDWDRRGMGQKEYRVEGDLTQDLLFFLNKNEKMPRGRERGGEQKCHSADGAGENWVGNLRREERERRKKEKSEGRGVFIGNPGSPKQRVLQKWKERWTQWAGVMCLDH